MDEITSPNITQNVLNQPPDFDLMTYRARNHLEHSVLESFDEKLEEDDDVPSEVAEIITQTLETTTLSQPSEAEDVVNRLIEEVENVSE